MSGRGRILIKDDSGDQCGTRIEVEYSDEGVKAFADVGTQDEFPLQTPLTLTHQSTCPVIKTENTPRVEKIRNGPLAKVSKTLTLREESGSFGIGIIRLLNIYPRPILFKLKTTAPSKYNVVPPIGSITPGGEAHIRVEIRKKRKCEVREDSFMVKIIELPHHLTLNHPEGGFSPPHCQNPSPNYYDFSTLSKLFEKYVRESSSFVESHQVDCSFEKVMKDASTTGNPPSIYENSGCQFPETFRVSNETKPSKAETFVPFIRMREDSKRKPTVKVSQDKSCTFGKEEKPYENEMPRKNRVLAGIDRVNSSARRLTILQCFLILGCVGLFGFLCNILSN